jgi:hypothetical protein
LQLKFKVGFGPDIKLTGNVPSVTNFYRIREITGAVGTAKGCIGKWVDNKDVRRSRIAFF